MQEIFRDEMPIRKRLARNTREHLNAFLLSLADLHVHANGVPGRELGRSVLRDGFSTSSRISAMTCSSKDSTRYGGTAKYSQVRVSEQPGGPVLFVRFAGLLGPQRQQVGSSLPRGLQRARSPPALDAGIVAGEKNLGNGEPAELAGARVVRVVETSDTLLLPCTGSVGLAPSSSSAPSDLPAPGDVALPATSAPRVRPHRPQR